MKFRAFSAALLLAFGTGAASADVLVVRASGPSAKSFPAGKSLADDARISLKANDSIVLLDSRGARTLRGPGTFTPSAPVAASNRSVIATAATNSRARRARIGAVRNVGAGPVRSPSIWHVDISKSSNICLADAGNVTLWRADATQAVKLMVSHVGESSETLDWPAGQSTLGWPADMTIGNDADYRLSWTGSTAPTELKFRTLPAEPGGLEDLASSLIRNDCQAQLDLLVETLKVPDAQPNG